MVCAGSRRFAAFRFSWRCSTDDVPGIIRISCETLQQPRQRDLPRRRSEGGAWERLLARSIASVEFGLKHPGHYKVLFEGRVAPRLNDPSTANFGRPLLVRSIELIREIAPVPGSARVSDDPQRLALLLWSGLHGIVSLRVQTHDRMAVGCRTRRANRPRDRPTGCGPQKGHPTKARLTAQWANISPLHYEIVGGLPTHLPDATSCGPMIT